MKVTIPSLYRYIIEYITLTAFECVLSFNLPDGKYSFNTLSPILSKSSSFVY